MPRLSNTPQTQPAQAARTFRLVGGRVTPQGTTPPTPVRASAPKPAPSADQIRQLAYHKWEAAGSPPGDGIAFWLAAERELTER